MLQVASYTDFFADALIAEAERHIHIVSIHAVLRWETRRDAGCND